MAAVFLQMLAKIAVRHFQSAISSIPIHSNPPTSRNLSAIIIPKELNIATIDIDHVALLFEGI